MKKMINFTDKWLLLIEGEGDDTSGGGGGADSSVTPTETPAPVDVSKVLSKPGDEPLARDEIQALMRTDPVTAIAERKRKQQEEAEKTSSNVKSPFQKTEAKGKTPIKPNGADQNKTPQQPATTPLDPNVKALVDTVQKVVTRQAKPQEQTKIEEPKNFYGGHIEEIQIDPRAMEALDSDDPNIRTQAMGAIVNGVANVVVNDVMSYVHQAVIPNIMKQAVQQAQVVYQQQQFEQLLQEAHPIYSDKNLRPVINQLGAALAKAKQDAGIPVTYNRDFINELTPAVLAYIQARAGNNASQQEQTVVSSKPREQVYAPAPRSRPPAESDAFLKSADLLDSIGIKPRNVN